MPDPEIRALRVPAPPNEPLPEVPESFLGTETARALGVVEQHPHIAWRVQQALIEMRLAGPWEDHPGRRDCWVRRDHKGMVVASVWWERDAKGELVEGPAGRARVHADESDPLEYPTVAVALIYTDTALREQGWWLVPPFGTTG